MYKKINIAAAVLLFCTAINANTTSNTCVKSSVDAYTDLAEMLSELVEKYADANDNNGLQLAIIYQETQTAQFIAESLAEIDAFLCHDTIANFLMHVNRDGDNVLHTAASYGAVEVASALLESKSAEDLLSQPNQNRDSAVHVAVKAGQIEVVNLFLRHLAVDQEACANFGAYSEQSHYLMSMDERGMTILDVARESNNSEMIELIESFARPISERCNMPIERFALYQKKLNYAISVAKSYIQTRQIIPAQMGEGYLFEYMQGLSYLTKSEVSNHQLRPIGGRLLSKAKMAASDFYCYPSLIYVLSLSDELFVGCTKYGEFHHGSFLAGADVTGAGHLEVEAGKVTSISHASGHYAPNTRHFIQTVFKLYDRGVIDQNTSLRFFAPSGGFEIKLSDFLAALKQSGTGYCSLCPKDDVVTSLDWRSMPAPRFFAR